MRHENIAKFRKLVQSMPDEIVINVGQPVKGPYLTREGFLKILQEEELEEDRRLGFTRD